MLVNLKAALAARHLRQVDLALSLKIPPSTLSEIVCGRRQADASLRARIAEALRADEAWLFSYVTRIPGPVSSSVSPEMATAVACAGRET
jgi:transcriptional regulator with XRE-family HTH domain